MNYYEGLDPYQDVAISNLMLPTGKGSIMIFIDEADDNSDYHDDPSTFDNDKQEFLSKVQIDEQVGIFGVKGNGVPESILPDDLKGDVSLPNEDPPVIDGNNASTVFPEQTYYVQVNRPPDLEVLKEYGIPSSPTNNKFFFFHDNSGSMNTEDVQPTFSDYVEWLRNELPSNAQFYVIEIRTAGGTDGHSGLRGERWLQWAITALGNSSWEWGDEWLYENQSF